jgi:nucleoside-diphosphate-sugar epimerase
MKVFITGIEGYIGSVLRTEFELRGHTVTGVDTGFYTETSHAHRQPNSIIHDDIRNVPGQSLAGFDAVIHLADLSNDPLGTIDEETTQQINFHAAVEFAAKAKRAGVTRYVYSSSCSVYGNYTGSAADERAPTLPQTMYARCKLMTENEIAKLADRTFCPVYLRNSTVYGWSPNMRFDLVINKLVADAFLFNEIMINNGGDQWRPLIHIQDVCRAYIAAIEAPADGISNSIFNIGNRDGNYRISELGEMIADEFPECTVTHGAIQNVDSRSYRVSFEKAHTQLPGFFCTHTLREGITQLHETYRSEKVSKILYEKPQHTRVKQILHLLQSKQLNNQFFWNENQ